MDQQKILGYFIEEAKEHLETLETGLLELSAVVEDQERLNEMFRAAHSIKGGAAMLGYSSIQKIAHRLEDSFKILRENKITTDQKLESLFLKGYDVLQSLIEKLQGTFGLNPEEANKIVEEAEPFFKELQAYLTKILDNEDSSSNEDVFAQVRALLTEMLSLFQKKANTKSRQSLQKLCGQLGQLFPKVKSWQDLTQTASSAIGNPQHSYATLAPVIIKELKQNSDYIELKQENKVNTGDALEQLAEAQLPYILVSLDPHHIAETLRKVLNSQQLSNLAQAL
ncbi:Hpt domain-containing protein [Crocosphaera watsonii WH 8501]|uniref:Hpt n=3 Tax=Crocosphaera watsonii TaxID=263511 RepID=Q4C7T1_CROWT|nr:MULTISPECIES: Hpt domain-containing protein [Crocosphaera]EAM52540.1 Hpt [Crocosphaera watsonii WH 8501]EHJ14243.1 Hpt [Crocosphaera watsonii WH 0003]MCH2246210.1 Hpt domain-containing protein [Crocosphaera sp.]NQZ64060.1 Hpt domain-containing protein [Crocosphaera sp.]